MAEALNKKYLDNYEGAIRVWLYGILLFLPFQFWAVVGARLWSHNLSVFFSRIDEFTIILLFPLALLKAILTKKRNTYLELILLTILLFSISGMISGYVNGNLVKVTVHGIYTYVKYFLVIYIYAAFFNDYVKVKNVFRMLMILTVVFGAIAFIQEIWAMGARYILEKEIHNSEVYLLRYTPVSELEKVVPYWRYGIYRASSLMNHSNMFGIYSLLILGIYLFSNNKVKISVVLCLMSGVLFSISRIVYAGFIALAIAWNFRNRKWMPIVIIFVVVVILANIFFLLNISTDGGVITYRQFSAYKASQIWMDNPIWGVGPGMFGGALSLKYNSQVYNEYNLKGVWSLDYIKGIDQFWPQLLVETGFSGAMIFVGLMIFLIISFRHISNSSDSDDRKGLYTALTVFTLTVFIYCWGISFNLPVVIFTYFAFVGMCLGNPDRENEA